MSSIVINITGQDEKPKTNEEIEKEVNNVLNEKISVDTHVSMVSLESHIHPNSTFFDKVCKVLNSRRFHYTVVALVLLDLIIVLVELILSLNIAEEIIPDNHKTEEAEFALFLIGACILGFFVLEIILKFIFIGWRHFLNPWQFVDVIVVFSSFIMEIYFECQAHKEEEADKEDALLNFELHSHSSEADKGNHNHVDRVSATALIIVRLWKFVRIIHAVAHAVEIKNNIIIEHVEKAKEKAEERIRKHKHRVTTLRRLVQEQQDVIKRLYDVIHSKDSGDHDNSEKKGLLELDNEKKTKETTRLESDVPTYQQSIHSTNANNEEMNPQHLLTSQTHVLPVSPPYSPRAPPGHHPNLNNVNNPRMTGSTQPISQRSSHLSTFPCPDHEDVSLQLPEDENQPIGSLDSVNSYLTTHSDSNKPPPPSSS